MRVIVFSAVVALSAVVAIPAMAQPEMDDDRLATASFAECACKDVLSPAQVADAFWEELLRDPNFDNQVDIVAKYLALVSFDTDRVPVARIDRLALGEGAFLTFQADLADEYFASVLEGSDLIASHAWERMMQVQFRAFSNVERARGMVGQFYGKFPPSVLNIRGRYQQIGNFMSYHQQAGEPERAINYLIEELESLPDDSPHLSYRLLTLHAELIENSPRRDQIRSIVSQKLETLKALQKRWAQEEYPASDDPILRGDMPAWYWRNQGVRPGESLRAARSRQLGGQIEFIEDWLQS